MDALEYLTGIILNTSNICNTIAENQGRDDKNNDA